MANTHCRGPGGAGQDLSPTAAHLDTNPSVCFGSHPHQVFYFLFYQDSLRFGVCSAGDGCACTHSPLFQGALLFAGGSTGTAARRGCVKPSVRLCS